MRLSEANIRELESRGCSAEDWSRVEIENFDSSRFRAVRFSGDVKIASQSGVVAIGRDIEVRASISSVMLHNCTIGRDVYINDVRQYISNYQIGDSVVISAVDSISAPAGATFGNGVKVSVLNEAGGREVTLYDNLSSQVAYLMALYRQSSKMVDSLEWMVEKYVREVRLRGAYIGTGAVVKNCGEIDSVKIGDYAVLDGVSRLVDGSINSTKQAKTYVGRGVIAQHFIISSAAKVTDGVLLDRCFVGQGSELGKQFSAENSLFFSNCIAMHGETCATFAGPYTVTHHKSTLLIGGMFSFMNAGSGSNQSNHMYKFGPVHQGVVERGCKLASSSYILWPMRIGPFSLIIGNHYSNADTSKLPFSYIIEKDYGDPVIIPAATLRSVGTIRDVAKWPKRDKRGGGARLDVINFKLLTPYTVGRMVQGMELLEGMIEMGGQSTTEYVYGGCKMKRNYLERGIEFYNAGIDKFIGDQLLGRLFKTKWSTIEEVRVALTPSGDVGVGQWVDISGALCPQSEVQRVVDTISEGKYSELEDISNAFREIDSHYDDSVWNWSVSLIEKRLGVSLQKITKGDIASYMDSYLAAVESINRGIYDDASKEFSARMRIGFGVDGDKDIKNSDFEAVRGKFNDNDFVQDVLNHSEEKRAAVAKLNKRLNIID